MPENMMRDRFYVFMDQDNYLSIHPTTGNLFWNDAIECAVRGKTHRKAADAVVRAAMLASQDIFQFVDRARPRFAVATSNLQPWTVQSSLLQTQPSFEHQSEEVPNIATSSARVFIDNVRAIKIDRLPEMYIRRGRLAPFTMALSKAARVTSTGQVTTLGTLDDAARIIFRHVVVIPHKRDEAIPREKWEERQGRFGSRSANSGAAMQLGG